MSKWDLALLIVSLGFAGLVKGVTGMGLPLFATPILAGIFGARTAVVIMSIPSFVANVLLAYEGRRILTAAREVWLVALSGAVGVVAGLLLLVRLDPNLLALVIAGVVFLILACGDRVLGTDPKTVSTRLIGLLVGGFSGLIHGGTSISGPLLAGYLHARRVPSREFVASIAVILQVFSIVNVIGLWRLGLYDRTTVTTGLLSLIPSLLAFYLGIRVRDRLNNATFRKVISVLLVLSALNLLVQGLRGLGVLP
ncbi:MAG: sulfite exporter TauE/SafE family protein [Candidatus Rokubacteria bacterium]|nr:sulfite exporter TauE/SafE family protein [Candidatus Rokubacteria bacterium]